MTPETGKLPVDPTPNGPDAYEFGEFHLDLRQRALLHSGQPVKLPRKTFDLLTVLVRNSGRIVDKSTLMNTVWEGAFVEDANLTVHVSRLRKLFSSNSDPVATIETFPKTGYRFNAEVREIRGSDPEVEANEGPQARMPVPEAAAREVHLPRHSGTAAWTRVATAVFVLAILLFGSGYFLSNWYRPNGKLQPSVVRVPGTEQSSSIAFSPNGEYIAHSVSAAGKRTLTMTHVKSGSNLPLLPPEDPVYHGMTFSRDSSFLYFVRSGPEFNSLYKIPILGGSVTPILDRVDSRISFSPDGARFCFVRKLPGNVTVMMVANADGTGEREIARRSAPQYYSAFEISWSPDGKLIANAAGSGAKVPDMQLIGVEVESGREIVLNDQKWATVDGLEWLPDGRGLIGGMAEGPTSPIQVWLAPFPSGEPTRITSDLENYGSVGVSADGSAIMAGQFKDNTAVWVVPPGEAAKAHPVKTGKHHKFNWVRWLSDNSFTFGSDAGEHRDVWRMNLDGSDERALTNGPQANVMPMPTSDGRFIIFSAFRDDNGLFELWRMGPDGSNPTQITPTGGGAWQPTLTPDGKWAFYTAGQMDGPPLKRRIWKVPVEGGDPVPFADRAAYQPDVSADGRFLACWIKADERSKPQAAIFPIGGGEPIKVFDSPIGNRLDWTPDGKGLSYVVTVDAVSNVWTQPIDGGPPRQETNFTSETIRNFEWHPDGRLLVSRYHKTRDVILIRNFR